VAQAIRINFLGGFNLKLGIKCFIALVVALMASFCVSASDTTTKFQTGPFTVSVDLGELCNDINISKPVQSELISGETYTYYEVNCCRVLLQIDRFDKDTFDLTEPFDTSLIKNVLSRFGVDKDTIEVYAREINSQSGVVGEGYLPESDATLYTADFYVSPKSRCFIYVWDNETEMISILKTIHITEAAT